MSDELRDKVAQVLLARECEQKGYATSRLTDVIGCDWYRKQADAVLALPEIREALEARATSRKLAGFVADAELARDEARAALAAAQAREAEYERAVEALREERLMLARKLGQVEHHESRGYGGQYVNGFAAAHLPDWEIRQRLEAIDAALAAVDAARGVKRG